MQGPDTVFKIIPEQWNNVPKIIYDSITALIYFTDDARKQHETEQVAYKRFVQEMKSAQRANDTQFTRLADQAKSHTDREIFLI